MPFGSRHPRRNASPRSPRSKAMAHNLHTRRRNREAVSHCLSSSNRILGLQPYVTPYVLPMRANTPTPHPTRLPAPRPFHVLTSLTEDPKSTPFRLNALATILLPSIVPFTLLAMAPTNDKLLGKKDELATASLSNKNVEAFAAEGETVHELMDKWASLNMARAMLVAVGAVCTVASAVVGRRELVKFGGRW